MELHAPTHRLLSTLDAKTKSDETLRVSIPFKDQVSANAVKKQMRDLSSKIGIDVQPIYTRKKLEQFQCIADHRYSAIGRHLRDARGTIDLLNESQFTMPKKCGPKWDCLV